MSVLRTIEQKIESLVEGVFGRAFRTNVQPVELARKLIKEMDDNRTVSVSRVYVPNEYTVYLSPPDRAQFEAYEESLRLELQEYLAEHARREGYVMLSPPIVVITSDADLSVGEFGIATRMVQRPRRAGTVAPPEPAAASAALESPNAAPAPVAPEGPADVADGLGAPVASAPAGAPVGATMVYRPRPDESSEPGSVPVEREVVSLSTNDRRYEVTKQVVLLGRSQECDIRLADPNVSRKHAELRQEGTAYWVVDLGSTNGTEVNGQPTKRAKLEHGDTITLGSTDVVFERSVSAASGKG